MAASQESACRCAGVSRRGGLFSAQNTLAANSSVYNTVSTSETVEYSNKIDKINQHNYIIN